MNIQKSFLPHPAAQAHRLPAHNPAPAELEYGKLYLVATPIGNLEDMTFRAVNTLHSVDWIAAEDTRQTKKLLNHFEISTRLFSYHEHNKMASGERIIDLLKEGQSVALVSDAGTPAVSDPGMEIVEAALAEGLSVIPIPGANAAISALIASGLNTKAFTFLGFLPREKKQLTQTLDQWKNHTETLVLYESPHRIKKTLAAMFEVWGDRRISCGRELTKRHEEWLRGTVASAMDYFANQPPIGEFCLVVEGNLSPEAEQIVGWWEGMQVVEHVKTYMNQGHSKKEAMKLAAGDRGVSKRDLYDQCHEL
ncbi:16S rRNA (cytidine(1402)-2'-O)-methyltransferase [Marinicrinis sediminis]|uniref:Ribosomal RNA small subunit methyltransferase I n=1 Tax=Marinicrinis sediminis TaxID=1652465 RepID=A0ABW5R978_9BACL